MTPASHLGDTIGGRNPTDLGDTNEDDLHGHSRQGPL